MNNYIFELVLKESHQKITNNDIEKIIVNGKESRNILLLMDFKKMINPTISIKIVLNNGEIIDKFEVAYINQ